MYKIIEIKKPTETELELGVLGGYINYNDALMFKIATGDYKVVATSEIKEDADKIILSFQLENISQQSALHYELIKNDDSEILADNCNFYKNIRKEN